MGEIKPVLFPHVFANDQKNRIKIIQQHFEWHGVSNFWHRLWIADLISENLDTEGALCNES